MTNTRLNLLKVGYFIRNLLYFELPRTKLNLSHIFSNHIIFIDIKIRITILNSLENLVFELYNT